jgi:hypothetical protein
MKRSLYILAANILPIVILVLRLPGCVASPEERATQTATAQTATAAMWTVTPSLTFTPTITLTDTATPTDTLTPTITFTPSLTPTLTWTFTPTYDFPKVTVNKAMAACLYGPAKAYLWKFDLSQGDRGVVWGRAANSNWLYVKMDRWPDACWLSPYVVDVVGDTKRMLVQSIRLPMANNLYKSPQNVKAERNGTEVTVSWGEVWMTEDDDRGYFLDVWVCQNNLFVWVPTSLPDQFHTSVTFVDDAGCSQPSGGLLYTVEKHGYTDPVKIDWPANR